MKSLKLGAASGCVVWLVTFFILGGCLVPVGLLAGSITSTVTGDAVAEILTPYMCPEGSEGKIHTYPTTTTDEYGFEQPSTGFEMRCVDATGEIVKDLGPTYGFVWIGLLGGAALIVAALLALLLAAPAGALLAKLFNRTPKTTI